MAATAVAAALALTLAVTAQADRTALRPGWNLFSPQQDVEIGQKTARDAERQLPMLNDPRVDNYLNRLGHQLSAHAPGYKFSYQYKCVNDMAINAFALPGGFVYVNRGVIEAADDEAQLAGVMAHETSHVVLRHGTNQATKAYAAQVPLSILGGILGNSVGGALAQIGAGFTLNSIFLKYSRTDESQADILGTQIMYDTGYDPRGMAQFFEKIEAENKSRPIEFFSNHPSPEHRVGRVDEEIDKLGGARPGSKTDSTEFQDIKRYIKSLPPPPRTRTPASGSRGQSSSQSTSRPALPSSRLENFENSELRIQHPDNWQAYGQGNVVSFAPDGGIVDDGQGNASLAYGMIVNLYEPQSSSGQLSLEQATDQLVAELQRSNPRMSIARRRDTMRLNGRPALSTFLSNDSPLGGRETDWLVTTARPDGVLYFVSTAPEREYASYERAFQSMIDSVRLP
jgi:hypothetical protein